MVHLAWGAPEVDWTLSIHEREHDLRAAHHRALPGPPGDAAGEELEAALREGDPLRSPAQAGRALRVLAELGLVGLDRTGEPRTSRPPSAPSSIDSAAFRAYRARGEDEQRFLRTATTARNGPATAAAAA